MKLTIAENIREHRRNLKLSQECLADRLGVSFQAVSKWERGETYPDLELLPAIASFFHITVDELIGANRWEEENVPMPCLQMLAYPVTDARMETESMKRFTDTPQWNSQDNERMWDYYCGKDPELRKTEGKRKRG